MSDNGEENPKPGFRRCPVRSGARRCELPRNHPSNHLSDGMAWTCSVEDYLDYIEALEHHIYRHWIQKMKGVVTQADLDLYRQCGEFLVTQDKIDLARTEKKVRTPSISITREDVASEGEPPDLYWVAKMGVVAAQARTAEEAVYQLAAALAAHGVAETVREGTPLSPERQENIDSIAGPFRLNVQKDPK